MKQASIKVELSDFKTSTIPSSQFLAKMKDALKQTLSSNQIDLIIGQKIVEDGQKLKFAERLHLGISFNDPIIQGVRDKFDSFWRNRKGIFIKVMWNIKKNLQFSLPCLLHFLFEVPPLRVDGRQHPLPEPRASPDNHV